jgi:hypothetical protein
MYFIYANDMLANVSKYNPITRGATMRQVTISATMMVFATLLASAPAAAVENWGPNKNGVQCFTAAKGESRDLQFGHWGSCPQTASAVSNTAVQPRRTVRRATR